MRPLPGLEVFLQLLAFEGMFLTFYYYYNKGKKTTISRREALLYKHSQVEQEEEEIFEVDETKKDYLSQLPDDILSIILENLSVRDAAKTTILSTRWKYLFDYVHPIGGPRTKLKFNCLNMFGVDTRHIDRPYHEEKNKFKNVLNRSLQLYSGDRVAHIEINCCFAKEFISGFSYWLQSISKLGVETLHLSFECAPLLPIHAHSSLITFSLDTLSQTSHLFLSFCIVLSSPKVHFNSLATLYLHGVVLERGQFEGIMSSCSNLKELSMKNCKLPSKVRLDSSTITTFVILDCFGGKKIELYAAYLHTLEGRAKYNSTTFYFSFAPMLKGIVVRS